MSRYKIPELWNTQNAAVVPAPWGGGRGVNPGGGGMGVGSPPPKIKMNSFVGQN